MKKNVARMNKRKEGRRETMKKRARNEKRKMSEEKFMIQSEKMSGKRT